MAVPDFQAIMLPLLKMAEDGQEHSLHDAIENIAHQFNLSPDERNITLSNKQKLIYNRVYWAKAYLKMARLVENTKRAHFIITDRGKNVLKEKPTIIDVKYLKRFPEFLEAISPKKDKTSVKNDIKDENEDFPVSKETPEEIIFKNHNRIRKALAQEFLSRLKSNSPSFFEEAVVQLLVKMGYGGSVEDAGKAIGKRGDEGIDGTIKEDKLGLDIIYVQAKRWDSNSVGRPEIQKFVGALAGQGAKKGVFITTSYFSKEALEYVPRNETKIVLIDGEQLAEYMIDYDLGVTAEQTFVIKKIDNDFFEE